MKQQKKTCIFHHAREGEGEGEGGDVSARARRRRGPLWGPSARASLTPPPPSHTTTTREGIRVGPSESARPSQGLVPPGGERTALAALGWTRLSDLGPFVAVVIMLSAPTTTRGIRRLAVLGWTRSSDPGPWPV